MNAWQTIDNAPRDGTRVDLWYPGRDGRPGFRVSDAYWVTGKFDDYALFDGRHWVGGLRNGWFAVAVDYGDDGWCDAFNAGPSHWMQIPGDPLAAVELTLRDHTGEFKMTAEEMRKAGIVIQR